MAIGDSLKNIIMPNSSAATPSSSLQSVINPSTSSTSSSQPTPQYKSVNIGGNSFTSDYMNDPNNTSTLQKLVANNQNNMTYTGNDGNNYDLMTGKAIPSSTSAPMTYTPTNIQAPTATSNSPMTYTPPTNTVTNNSGQISDMYGQQLSSAQAALKASIQQSMGQYQDTINKAPATYQPLRNQASAAGASNMQNLKEMLANNGQQGGVNRTESTAINSATENNINSLNQQQQSVIDTANKAINDLQAQGDIKGAELVAQNASDKLQALIAESNRVESATNTNNQQNFSNGMAVNQYNSDQQQNNFNNGVNLANLTGTYNGQSTLSGQQLQHSINQDNINNNINIAGLTGTYNGQQTVAGKSANASIENTNANTEYQNLVNQGYPEEQASKMAQAKASLTGTNLGNDYQSLLNAGYPAKQAADLAQIAAQTQSTNASTAGQLIQNQYAGQIAQGQIDATKATTAYQTMVNNNYPQEEALKIAGIIAQNQGQVLDNNAKAIANKYQPQILQGQIDGTKLANTYQSLVNNGYNAAQAADIAVKYATIRQNDTQNAIAQQNANTSRMNALNSGRSGGGGGSSSSSSNGSNDVTTSAWNTMSNIYQKYGYGTMISWLSQNKSSITSSVGKDEYQKMVDAASKLQQNIRNDKNYNDKSKAW